MTKYRFRAKLENLIKEWHLGSSAEAKYRCEAYKELLEYINSMQEEHVSEVLEEAANDYAHDLVHDDVFETFIAGARWQKERLIDKAVKWLYEHREEVQTEDNGISGWISDELIMGFKKAMKE